MASGQTQYYGLSQWEAADKVERVDFNSDNARVDGAPPPPAGGRAGSPTAPVGPPPPPGRRRRTTPPPPPGGGRIYALESGKADKTELAAQIRALSQSHEADTAALRSENCWVRLGEWSVTEESSLISLSFPEIDKSRFRQLRLHFHICGVSALGNVILRMNQVSSGQYDTGGDQQDRRPVSLLYQLSFCRGIRGVVFYPRCRGPSALPCLVLFQGGHEWFRQCGSGGGRLGEPLQRPVCPKGRHSLRSRLGIRPVWVEKMTSNFSLYFWDVSPRKLNPSKNGGATFQAGSNFTPSPADDGIFCRRALSTS